MPGRRDHAAFFSKADPAETGKMPGRAAAKIAKPRVA